MARYEDGYDPHYGYNINAFKYQPIHLLAINKVVKLIAGPFGLALASEAIHEHRSKKAQKENDPVLVQLPPQHADRLIASGHAIPTEEEEPTHTLVDYDEQDWALDDMLLAFPVILPQRRPRTKTRGFVHAYAPGWQDAGINQATFLRFLKDLHTHTQASPVLEVLSIAAGIAGVYPDLLIAGVVQTVQIAATAGREIQERWSTNRFLDQMNREMFMPRGLYALIVQYESTTRENTEVGTKTVDLGAQAVTQYGGSFAADAPAGEQKGWKEKTTKRLRQTTGKTHGEAGMPLMCAPLVFPGIEQVAHEMIDGYAQGSESASNAALRFKDKAKGASKRLADYFDRRAQADFAFDNPNSTLVRAMGDAAPQFKSKLSDPNDQRNKHLATLVAGGKLRAEP
ncbi:hypothetical protein BO86DRAFT_404583 [Aspergillus japonicus CBS 114.51]|uniref:Uncharacterized protein n=1 Tax=Aspergillus japonicus CBS 114.51 TaxID=1448312 RepID=A0A8T8WLC5_ASPJA|nr:hypothetical protein BO86DRAFT_404583 [Aspergillus japonicus CBS 114.51]RAH76513.1 hypothetical protein BO86DRAFT_404583 [Aspergillus japonicus CBS 114.51]